MVERLSTQQMIKGIVSPQLNEAEHSLIKASKIQLPEHSHGHLSPSQITMYLARCGMQYYYRYVMGIKSPPGVALVEGGSHHSVFEVNNKYKIKVGRDKRAGTLAERFADTFNDRQKKIPKRDWKMSGENKDSVIKRGRALQTLYANDIAPMLKPAFAEERVVMRVGTVNVQGIIDVGGSWSGNKKMGIEKGRGVMDYKVVGKAMSRGELENMISLSFYGWSCLELIPKLDLVKRPPQVGFCALKKLTVPVVQWQAIDLQIQRIKWFRRIVLSTADAISRGAFPICDPTSWCCSSRFCGYWGRCKGKVK